MGEDELDVKLIGEEISRLAAAQIYERDTKIIELECEIQTREWKISEAEPPSRFFWFVTGAVVSTFIIGLAGKL